MNYLILILIVGLHIAPLVIFGVDMWRAEGIWTSISALLMLCTLLIQKPLRWTPKNLPLSLLLFWVGSQVAFICYTSIAKGFIDVKHFFSFFNFLMVVILYILMTCYLNKEWINRILLFIKYCIVGELLLCVLQFFGLSQFFQLFQPNDYRNYNMVVGLLGNGTHLSGFLATTACLFLDGKRENNLILALMVMVLFLCGTTIGDPAISGVVVLICTSLFYIFNINRKNFYYLIAFLFLCSMLFLLNTNKSGVKEFLSFNGRLDIWKYYWNVFKTQSMQLTGYGLGTVESIFQKTPFPRAMYLHNEYFQYLFELGIIGFVLILNFILDFSKITTNCLESLKCKTMCIGFLISSLFNYPSHLWMPSVYFIFSYSSLMALERGSLAHSKP